MEIPVREAIWRFGRTRWIDGLEDSGWCAVQSHAGTRVCVQAVR